MNAATVVTGGARGIGRAIVSALTAGGSNVLALDVSPATEGLTSIQGEGRVLALACDVTDESAVSSALAAGIAEFGGINGLVNNAGITAYYDPVDMSQAEWHRVFGVDLMSAWLCAKHAIPHLRAAGGGSIVNISSIHARLTVEGMFPYAAAKAGLEGLTRSLALELASSGVRVNAVAPGYVNTEMSRDWIDRQPDPMAAEATVASSIPLGRMAEPHEVAAVVAFLLSSASSAITGSVIPVDCGLGIRFRS